MGFTSKQKMFMKAAKAWAEKHGKDLSHVDKNCNLCRSHGRAGDVSRSDSAGREWVA